jgi:hypothetical protein
MPNNFTNSMSSEGGMDRGGHLTVAIMESCPQSGPVEDGVNHACRSYKMEKTGGSDLRWSRGERREVSCGLLTGE